MNARRVTAVAVREMRELFRDRLFFTLAFLVPSLLMIIFNYGLSMDVQDIPFVIVDYDRTQASRELGRRFADSRYFELLEVLDHTRGLDKLLMDNKARAALVIPEHFQERILSGRTATFQTLVDGTFPFRAKTTAGYALGISQAWSEELTAEHLASETGMSVDRSLESLRPVTVEERYLFNQSLESDRSMAPKLIMLVLMVTSPLLTALGVVREKETGAILNIYASTVTRGEYLAGKLAPYVVLSWCNAMVLWGIAMMVFGAPFKGSALLFAGACLVYVVCTTGIGLVVSVIVRTQLAATLVTFVVTVIPAVMYSGIFVPIASLEPSARLMAKLLPAMYFTKVTVGSFLKAQGATMLWDDVLLLGVYAATLMAVGFLLFTKRPRA